MSQQANITINGFVGADPVSFGQAQGVQGCSFRLGCTRRYFHNTRKEWVDQPTTWITVKAFRTLASNVLLSVHKGDPVVVTGMLSTENWQQDGANRSRIVIEANTIGHDLALGVSTFQRARVANKPSDGSAEGQVTAMMPTDQTDASVGSDPFVGQSGDATTAQGSNSNAQGVSQSHADADPQFATANF